MPHSLSLPAWLHRKPRWTTTRLTLVIALFLVLFDNVAFWQADLKILHTFSLGNLGFLLSQFVVLLLLLNLFLSLACFRYIFKPLAISVLISASLASYFMNSYGVMLDGTMMQNILQTDYKEASELLTPQLFHSLLLLGVLPSLFILRTEIIYRPLLREIGSKLLLALLSLLLIAALVFGFYPDYSSLSRNNRQLKYLINPTSYLYSLGGYIHHTVQSPAQAVKPLGEDARVSATWKRGDKKNLVILVLGETARQKNFSLNGYQRETNPFTRSRGVISFRNVYSCGTATAVSVPCLFSRLDRKEYSRAEARSQEGLLDVLAHAGIEVLWRDNNSGCKGTCDRIRHEKMAKQQVAGLCNAGECYDEILLHGLQTYIETLPGDALIVLHQKGSHGPAYYRRYPERFKRFRPVCATNQLRECPREEIVNAYDNSILYTDYFLARTIDLLKENTAQFNTAMVYISDHGESLGENNLYLHGLPYFIAPDEQKHVPLLLWFSDEFARNNRIDPDCLRGETTRTLSHDNLFHSLLGLMGVSSTVYDGRRDLFAGCRG